MQPRYPIVSVQISDIFYNLSTQIDNKAYSLGGFVYLSFSSIGLFLNLPIKSSFDIKSKANCAQTVPKICQKYRKICKNIKKYLKPNNLKNELSKGVTPYIFRFIFFLCLLHTVEAAGSNPASPTTFKSYLPLIIFEKNLIYKFCCINKPFMAYYCHEME